MYVNIHWWFFFIAKCLVYLRYLVLVPLANQTTTRLNCNDLGLVIYNMASPVLVAAASTKSQKENTPPIAPP